MSGTGTPRTPRVLSQTTSQPHTPINGGRATIESRSFERGTAETQDIDDEDEEEEDFIASPTDKHPRLSFYYASHVKKEDPERQALLNELDRVELSITQNLQKIHYNLSKCNAVIMDSMIPTLDDFKANSVKIFKNVNHIKEFYENAANVNILTKDDVMINNGLLHPGTSAADPATGDNSINTSNISEDLSIRNRYQQNFSSSNIMSPNIIHTNLNPNHSVTENLAQIDNTITNEHQYSSLNLSAFNTTRFNDESTAKTQTLKLSAHDYRHSLQEPIAEREEETNAAMPETEAELSPDSKRNKFVSDLVKGYESPPWENPPELQSDKFISPLKKKRKMLASPHRLTPAPLLRHHDSSDLENELQGAEEDEEEEEEEVSVRFPMSPKYGGGGKLLRSEEGRKLALDFARSEMISTHPILSLQSPHKASEDAGGELPDQDPTVTGTFYTMDSNSSIDNPPQLSVQLGAEAGITDTAAEQAQSSGAEDSAAVPLETASTEPQS